MDREYGTRHEEVRDSGRAMGGTPCGVSLDLIVAPIQHGRQKGRKLIRRLCIYVVYPLEGSHDINTRRCSYRHTHHRASVLWLQTTEGEN